MSPTRRTAFALGICALIAVALGPAPAAVAAAGVLGAMLADVWFARAPLVVDRRMPTILPRGQPVDFSISVTVSGPRLSVRLRQATPPEVVAEPSEGDGEVRGTLVAHRRGSHSLAPVAMRVTGPFGLAAVHRASGEETSITVYPDVITARRLAAAVGGGRFSEHGRRRAMSVGIGTEFESIRDYVPDDDIRQVNWRASLRVGRPMSNEYRVDHDRDVICLVDVGRLMAAPLGRMTRLDAAVDAVAAVAYAADEMGDRAGVVAFDNALQRHLAARRRGGEAVIHAVHDLEPTGRESDYEAAFRLVARAKRALVIVFTDLLEEAAAAPLVDSIPVLARKHQVIVAGSIDEDLVDTISHLPSSVHDVFRASAAVTALQQREQVSRVLRHASARVIDAKRGDLPRSCVSAYVDVKARARV